MKYGDILIRRKRLSRFLARILILGLVFNVARPICAASPEDTSSRAQTLQQLKARAEFQNRAISGSGAFHSFQLSNRIRESGITFVHQIVEDAGKTYRAAHYDHGNGMAVADVDGDGRLDLYFTTQLGSNELWRNLGNGRFENITATSGVGLVDQISVAAAFADIDNDGDPDLFVTTVRHGNHLFENLGGGRFKDITAESGLQYSGHSSGIVFFDFDNDGRLDLYIANVGVYTSKELGPGGFYRSLADAFEGHLHPERSEANLLYRNLGGNKFENVTAAFGVGEAGWSGDATALDMNQDGYPDLYVVNMQGDDHFFENQAGKKFVDRTAAYFPKTPWGAMGVKGFDFNQDGLEDVFITDMHSDMTKPNTEQALSFRVQIEKSKSDVYCAAQWTEQYLQGSSNNIFGNALYQNLGQGRFIECSTRLGAETYWPWGLSVGDLNADGFEDMVITAGMGYPFRYAVNSLLLNESGRKFWDAEFVVGLEPRMNQAIEKQWFTLDCDGVDKNNELCQGKKGPQNFQGALSSRSSAICDLDGDGDLDVVIEDFNDSPQILLNNLASVRPVHYLGIQLVGKKSNRDGLGAKVTLVTAKKRWTQFKDGKSGYLAQSSMPLYFGLNEEESVQKVEVQWPSGIRQSVTEGLSANHTVVIQEHE